MFNFTNETVQVTENSVDMGYDSPYFVQNTNSLLIVLMVYCFALTITLILRQIKL